MQSLPHDFRLPATSMHMAVADLSGQRTTQSHPRPGLACSSFRTGSKGQDPDNIQNESSIFRPKGACVGPAKGTMSS